MRRTLLLRSAIGLMAIQCLGRPQLGLAGAELGALSMSFPHKPLTLVVPFPPGGSSDVLGRKIADELSKRLGQPVIVENKAGAGGTVGARYVAQAEPDGHTLGLGVTGSHAISFSLWDNPPYNPVEDFVAVSLIVSAPLVLVVNKNVPANSFPEFLDYVRSNPGRATYGTPGVGTSMHLTGEMFDLAANTHTVHVPYRGTNAAFADFLGGQIDFLWGDLLVMLPQIQAGGVRALAVTSTDRHPMLSNVPTLNELGLKGFEALSWQALFVPKGTPFEIVKALNRHVVDTLQQPAIQDYFASQGFVVRGTTVEETAHFVARETEKWGEIVRGAGLTPW